MSLPKDIAKGKKIRNELGGTFKELRYLRQGLWALMVLTDQTNYSQEEIDKANQYKSQLLEINNKIKQILEEQE